MFDQESLLKMLKEIKIIFDEQKVPFWLEAGTLLGAVRDKKIIPWDTDIDLGAFKKDFSGEKRKELSKIFEKRGFSVYFFPEKVDIMKDGDMAIQIHLAQGPKDNYFIRQMADNRVKEGEFLYKIYRLSNVSYYGRFKLSPSRTNMKTNLFKFITFVPRAIRKKVSNSVMKKLTKIKDSGVYYINIPQGCFSKLKKIDFYGESFNIPNNPEKYLEMQYGDWRKPPKDKSQKWVWHSHGDWKKVYNKEEMLI